MTTISEDVRDILRDVLQLRVLELELRIRKWERRGAKLSRVSKDILINYARTELAQLTLARQELDARGACTPPASIPLDTVESER